VTDDRHRRIRELKAPVVQALLASIAHTTKARLGLHFGTYLLASEPEAGSAALLVHGRADYGNGGRDRSMGGVARVHLDHAAAPLSHGPSRG